MGWMNKCYTTYLNNLDMAGVLSQNVNAPLCPPYFILQKVQIEITINESGEFKGAAKVDKSSSNTLIAVTDISSRRTRGIAAHPLCDQLCYIGFGHPKHLSPEEYEEKFKTDEKDEEKEEKVKILNKCREYTQKYDDYIKTIKAWAESEYLHYIVRAVLAYCEKGEVIDDLKGAGIVEIDENKLPTVGQINGINYDKCMVRWRVISSTEAGSGECWADKTLFECYRAYRDSTASVDKDLCYVLGKPAVRAIKHSKGIVAIHNSSKLISSNDNDGFTYRGRFANEEQAYSVGAEATEKAHAALKWVAANQGVNYGSRVFVCWNTELLNVPMPDSQFKDDDEEALPQTMPEYKEALRKALNGTKDALQGKRDKDIVVMAMDAATTGRLAITYYNELDGSDFLERIRIWNETCCWHALKFKDKKPYLAIETPSNLNIIQYAFGTQQGDFVKVDDKLKKDYTQVLIRCIVDRQPLPYNIVASIVRRASYRSAYNNYNYEKLLTVTCALIKKYYNDKYKKEYISMELDVNNKDRSYLFGRLLAVAEKVERAATNQSDSGREPNAVRLQAAFVQSPMRTFKNLQLALIPYFSSLRAGSREYYRRLMDDIVATLEEQPLEKLNKPLSDLYLIGYHLQRKELNTFNKQNSEEDN